MTAVDSHLDMPVVRTPREALEAIHIPPFLSAIRAGADGIMISHCCYRALQDETVPASLSKAVVGGLLRRDLGFNGLVVTDSLDMDAVTAARDVAEAPREALDAGADILLYTDASPRCEAAFETLTADLVSGKLDPQGLMESVSRRQATVDRIAAIRAPKETISLEHYLELRDRVIRASVRTDDPKGLLPIKDTDIKCVTTAPGLLDTMRVDPKSIEEIRRTEDVRGKTLLLWLVEPLGLKRSLEAIRSMVDSARVSVLVTSYPALADTLAACDTKIVTDDTSPETQAAILSSLFG
jgi:beta-glucosidase-like glycosyl hydrolase